MESFRRAILFVEPDLILIRDRVRTKDPSTFSWLLHAPKPFVMNGPAEVLVESGGATCRVEFLAPAGLTLSQTDRFDPPPRERVELVEHHLSAVTEEEVREVTFLTVIRVVRTDQALPEATEVVCPGELWNVRAPRNGGRISIDVHPAGMIGAVVHDAGGEELLYWHTGFARLPD